MPDEPKKTKDTNATPPPVWVSDELLRQAGTQPTDVQVMESGVHKSAIVFTNDRVFLAEKGWFHKAHVYEVYVPERFVIEATQCPHCHKEIELPYRRVRIGPLLRGRREAASQRPAPKPPIGGDAYPVLEIEGIGPAYASRLEGGGIRTTQDLLDADVGNVVHLTGAPRTMVNRWFAMAELMKVKGIKKQFSELLVRSGVNSIDELAGQNASRLLKRLQGTQGSVDVTIQGAPLAKARVAEWIKEAKGMRRG